MVVFANPLDCLVVVFGRMYRVLDVRRSALFVLWAFNDVGGVCRWVVRTFFARRGLAQSYPVFFVPTFIAELPEEDRGVQAGVASVSSQLPAGSPRVEVFFLVEPFFPTSLS